VLSAWLQVIPEEGKFARVDAGANLVHTNSLGRHPPLRSGASMSTLCRLSDTAEGGGRPWGLVFTRSRLRCARCRLS